VWTPTFRPHPQATGRHHSVYQQADPVTLSFHVRRRLQQHVDHWVLHRLRPDLWSVSEVGFRIEGLPYLLFIFGLPQ
jgi:hypothetical protein